MNEILKLSISNEFKNTQMGFIRIKKNLDISNFSDEKTETYLKEILLATPLKDIESIGKNHYFTCLKYNAILTVNSHTHTIITAKQIKKKKRQSTNPQNDTIHKGCIHIIFGPIGAGKSTFAIELAKKHNAIKFSTDEWFKNLFFGDINSMPELKWTFERISRCESQIWSIAKQSINTGSDVIFDLGLQKVSDRNRISSLCKELNIKYKFYYLNADKITRHNRVIERNKGGDTFEFPVSPEIFEITNLMFELPTSSELEYTNFIEVSDKL
jgi:predicted kinase